MKKFFLLVIIFSALFWLFSDTALAAGYEKAVYGQLQATAGAGGADLGTPRDPRIVVGYVIQILLGCVGILLTAYLFYAGWLYIFSAGEDEKITKARSIILYCVIGLAVVISAYSIATIVLKVYYGETGYPSSGVYVQPDYSQHYIDDPLYQSPAMQVEYK